MDDQRSDSEDQTLFSRGATPLYSSDSRPDSVANSDDGPRRAATRDAVRSTPTDGAGSADDRRAYDDASADVQTSSRSADDRLYAIPPFDDLLGSVHEKALDEVGFGRLQWLLFVFLGCGLMGDGIELLLIAYILPGAEKDLCMNDEMKGWLGAIVFAGMMVGAVIWGNLADRLGRRTTLITSLSVNAIFSIMAAFMPHYWLLLVCRLLSGLGIGGSIPVAMTYFSEFCPRPGRGYKMCMLLLFWAGGGIYVAALGWLLIPNKELFDLKLSEDTTFHSWRMFLLVCSLPVIVSIAGVCAMPESPRFLLQIGKDLEALAVYRKMYLLNHTEAGAEYEMPEIQLPSNGNIRTIPRQPSVDIATNVSRALRNFWNSLFMIFVTPLTLTTFVLCAVWFSASFGYYGLSIWFPEYIKKLEQDAYFSKTNITANATMEGYTFTGILDNVKFFNVSMTNVTFKDIELRHVLFELCHVVECSFLNVTAARTRFVDSVVESSFFNDTNFYPEKFVGTELVRTDVNNTWGGCREDFDVSYSNRRIFLETFLTQLAVVPATLVCAFLMDRVGRRLILVACLFLSAVSVFFIWSSDTEVAVVFINAVFNCVSNGVFNAIDITTTELYPTHLRSTAFGFLSCFGRIAAILGNVAFGNLIGISKSIPVILTAAILGIGALVSVKLPESKDRVL